MRDSCGNCKYFGMPNYDAGEGRETASCVRYPPIVSSALFDKDDLDDTYSATVHLHVNCDWWCGEWAASE